MINNVGPSFCNFSRVRLNYVVQCTDLYSVRICTVYNSCSTCTYRVISQQSKCNTTIKIRYKLIKILADGDVKKRPGQCGNY